MDAVTYPDPTVRGVLTEHTVPVRLNILKERDLAKRYGAFWTPFFFTVDPGGRVFHSRPGFLPPAEFAAQVLLAVGLARFQRNEHDRAIRFFEEIASRFADTLSAPEAVYWNGVCLFKKTRDTRPIYDACRRIVERYPDSEWALKVGFVTRYKDFKPDGGMKAGGQPA